MSLSEIEQFSCWASLVHDGTDFTSVQYVHDLWHCDHAGGPWERCKMYLNKTRNIKSCFSTFCDNWRLFQLEFPKWWDCEMIFSGTPCIFKVCDLLEDISACCHRCWRIVTLNLRACCKSARNKRTRPLFTVPAQSQSQTGHWNAAAADTSAALVFTLLI